MSNSNENLTNSLIEYLHLALRYVASGFIAVATYMFLYNISDINSAISDKSWFFLFLSAAIGIITYALHFATIDKYIYRKVAYSLYKKTDKVSKELENAILAYDTKMGKNIHTGGFQKAEVTKKDLSFVLTTQTYLRNLSDSPIISKLQHQMEKRLAFLNFLYCSFYQLFIITMYFILSKLVKGHNSINIFTEDEKVKIIFLLIGCLVIIYSAVSLNKRICVRELWTIIEYPQVSSPTLLSGNTKNIANTNQGLTLKSMIDDINKNLDDITTDVKETKKLIG